jgi:glutamate carboxypeptidase
VIAKDVIVTGDLRTLSKTQLDKAKQTMEEIVAAGMLHTQATLTFDEGYPPLAPTGGNAKLLALYDRASRDLGFGPVAAVNPDKAGAADVSFVADEVPMIMDGVGLMGHDDHTAGETADLSTLPSQTKRASVTLYRLTKGR